VTAQAQHNDGRSGPHVVIAGGGVAALEALIALNHLKAGFTCELIAPEREFRYRPVMVAEPFGLGEVSRFDLAKIASEHGAAHRRDRLISVDTTAKVAKTQAGLDIRYDALLVATGAAPSPAIEGALTFGIDSQHTEFRRLLAELEAGEVQKVVFALPLAVKWALPLYELALLTAHHLSGKGITDRELALATWEDEPLSMFGSRASEAVGDLLARRRIAFHPSTGPREFSGDGLVTVAGGKIACERVVSLPRPYGPDIPGLASTSQGFISIDRQCAVRGAPGVYAAGDGTDFPIKQGGIAAQQADCAAQAIAASLGAAIEPVPFRPVLRAMLLTGEAPLFLRGQPTRAGVEVSTASQEALWYPAGKIAGRYLASYLATYDEVELAREPLRDRSPATAEADTSQAEAGHRAMVELMLALADADARWGDYRAAVQSLDAVQSLEGMLTPEQAKKRRTWLEQLQGGSQQAVD
jgi:sulfide:quinone oxidoreductase